MKVTSFSKQNLTEIRAEINAKLAELKSLGLDIKLGNVSFNANSFSGKIECRLEDAPDVFTETWNKSLKSYGIKDALGKPVIIAGKYYVFKGLRPRARVKDAIVERDGKKFRINFEAIRSQLL